MKRSVIRAVGMGYNVVVFELPEWKPNYYFDMKTSSVPHEQRRYLHEGFRCYVDFNPLAISIEELRLSNWGLI